MYVKLNGLRFLFQVLFVIIFCSGLVDIYAQQENSTPIVINSWQKGDGMVYEKSFKFKMTSSEFNLDIFGSDQKRRFRLQLEKIFVPTVRKPNPQCLTLALRELFEDETTGGELLGSNLFLLGNTLETSAHIICPLEKPVKSLDGGLYSVKADRVFHIENFIVSIKVLKFDYDTNENKLNSMEIAFDFKNRFPVNSNEKDK